MLCHIRGACRPIVEIAQSKNERAQLEESDEEKLFPRCSRQRFKIPQAVGARLAPWPRIE
jgi:hypothetical protein